jgi:hypothetical protein
MVLGVAYLQLFVYLQLLDLMTTLVGFRLGGTEVSPFAHWLTGLGPTTGIVLVKMTAFAIAAVCLRFHKERVIAWANYFFAVLVVWNLGQIWRAVA